MTEDVELLLLQTLSKSLKETGDRDNLKFISGVNRGYYLGLQSETDYPFVITHQTSSFNEYKYNISKFIFQ